MMMKKAAASSTNTSVNLAVAPFKTMVAACPGQLLPGIAGS
jgi:hypothetical protein